MGFPTLFLIALGLSMDAFAVSVSNGICYRRSGLREAVANGLTFGFFQALMPLIGYVAGRAVSGTVTTLDHWIALLLLGFIGGRMVVQAVRDLRHPEEKECRMSCTARDLAIQGVATSIDALAVGVSLAVVDTPILPAVALIGVVTFACSTAGVYLGKGVGAFLREKAEIFGGVMLILIGIKIFIEHWTAA